MKPILLLQYRTDESETHEQHCIAKKLGVNLDQLDIRNVIREQPLPSPQQLQNYLGVISGASGQFNVTDWPFAIQTAVEKTYPLMDEIINQDFPFLAICFGHQLLAKMYGGRVERNPTRAESGSTRILLTSLGQRSPLYHSLIPSFYSCNGHKDSVMELPSGAQLLAISPTCYIQSYKIKTNIFTTQFHPELNIEDVRFRLTLTPEYCFEKTVDEVLAEYKDITKSGIILQNFMKVMEKNEKER